MTKRRSPVFIGAIAAGVVLIIIGIVVLSFVLGRPRGVKIAESNLLASVALPVDAAPNDTLIFRTDVVVSVALISTMDDDRREREVDRGLDNSILTVRATSPTGVERTTTCPIYNGTSFSTTTTPGRIARSGMLNDCSIAIDAAGRWTVQGSVAWASGLSISSATFELRRETPAH